MKKQILIHKLIPRTFDLFKVNQVLVMPFLMFLLLVAVLFPGMPSAKVFVEFVLLALISVFLSGWLNMFHMCLENTQNDNISDEQKTINSLNLYKEFFPGVGKYFQKIFWGILLLNIIVYFAKLAAFYVVGNFQGFSVESLYQSLTTSTSFIAYYNKISNEDKIKLLKLATFNICFVGLLSYLTMLWTQFVVVEDKNPVKALVLSVKAVLGDPINTFLIFASMLISFIFVFGLNLVLGGNILGQLLALMLFAYVIVYYTMMTFLYFERYR